MPDFAPGHRISVVWFLLKRTPSAVLLKTELDASTVIAVSLEQPKNVLAIILLTLAGIVTFVRFPQL